MSGIAREYMTEDVTITRKGTAQANGTYAYDGAATATVARLKNKAGFIRQGMGREISYDRIFWVDESVSVSVGDRVTYGGEPHEVLLKTVVRDLAGDVDHQVLYCGRTG